MQGFISVMESIGTIIAQNQVLIVAVASITGVIWFAYKQSNSWLEFANNVVTGTVRNDKLTEILERFAEDLPEDKLKILEQIADVLDDNSDTIPGDLDKEVASWIRDVANGLDDVTTEPEPALG